MEKFNWAEVTLDTVEERKSKLPRPKKKKKKDYQTKEVGTMLLVLTHTYMVTCFYIRVYTHI